MLRHDTRPCSGRSGSGTAPKPGPNFSLGGPGNWNHWILPGAQHGWTLGDAQDDRKKRLGRLVATGKGGNSGDGQAAGRRPRKYGQNAHGKMVSLFMDGSGENGVPSIITTAPPSRYHPSIPPGARRGFFLRGLDFAGRYFAWPGKSPFPPHPDPLPAEGRGD